MTELQPVPEQKSRNAKLANFVSFAKLLKKTELLEKFELLDKRQFKLMETSKREKIPAPGQPPFIN